MARDLSTSPFARLMRIGRVTTRVGTSLAARRALDAIFSTPGENLRRTEHFVRNAQRVTEALGELKGAAMKVGQMLSVHEGFLPTEVCAVLQQLQREAPAVPWPRMEQTLEAELPGGLSVFESFDRTPLAAASIGQVYRAQLRDGRDVAVKVQYPGIDRVVAADLATLKKLFGSLLEMFVEIDFEPLWAELRARLLEELDYEQEAANVERMRAHYANDDAVLIPGVVRELSTRRVLVLDYVRGISPAAATSGAYAPALRDLWGRQLLRFVMSGLLEHRFLHADPNFGNFAFREDGRLVVYDHGCVKDVPEDLARGCAQVLAACLDQDMGALALRLRALGIYDRSTGAAVPPSIVEPLGREVMALVGTAPVRFERTSPLYTTLLDHDGAYIRELTRLELPADLMFVNRTLSGVFGNLCLLESKDRWRDVLAPYARSACKSSSL